MDLRLQFRREVLESHSASPSEVEELLSYNTNVFDCAGTASLKFPLPDEAFVERWRTYRQEVAEASTFCVLAKYFPQLRFPIQAGISQSPEYMAATTRGVGFSEGESHALALNDPEGCSIVVHATPAGHIPLVIADNREDFVTLVRALARRNEPVHIPDSMGACMIAGYNNWDRVFEAARKDPAGLSDPSVYQDRFMILSKGPYSGVPARAMGLGDEKWRALSLIVRRDHECTHYFTRRVFSSMRNNLLDEIIADYCGIVSACGHFRAEWMLRFFGLEDFPRYRPGARLENYRGNPQLSSGAFRVLQQLVKNTADNLGRISLPADEKSGYPLKMLLVLCSLTLEELAWSGAPGRIREKLSDAGTGGDELSVYPGREPVVGKGPQLSKRFNEVSPT